MKYIDADKLITEIEKKRKILVSEYNELAKYEVWMSANENKIKINTISDILSLITSLQQEQPEVDFEEEITDKTRACCNCVNGIPKYPNCYCWQHKYCNTDEPYKIPKEDWVETAKTCKEFEFEVLNIQPL